MNTTAVLKDGAIEMSASGATRRTAAERLVLTLTALGMIASVVAFMEFEDARAEITQVIVPTTVTRSTLYYAAHAITITLFMSAGLLALLSNDWRKIEPGYFARFMLFIGAALLMTARGYSFSALLSTELVDWTGPAPCFISLLVFVGAKRRNWVVLGKAMVILAVLLSTLALLRMTGLQTFTRAEGVASLTGILNALLWPASWIALKDYPRDSFARHVRFGPILIYTLGSLFTQTRLNFVMVFAFLAVHTYLQRKRKSPQAATWIVGLTLAVFVSLFTAVFLTNTRAFERVSEVAADFNSRLDEDSRTGQLIWFAESVPMHELLLGRGSRATWWWRVEEYAGGTDVGYLTLLFYGGVPLLLTYIATHVTPGLTAFRKNLASWQLAAAAVVVLWGLRMFSSNYPGLTLDYYPVLFFVGACISREPFHPAQPPTPYRRRLP